MDIEKKVGIVGGVLVFAVIIAAFMMGACAGDELKEKKVTQPVVLEKHNGILNLDESMKTGFLSTQDYEISFDYMEYPVATSEGKQRMHKVYTIYIRRYPALDVQIMHTVDSWEEAVDFLESRRG